MAIAKQKIDEELELEKNKIDNKDQKMKHQELLKSISVNSKICFGKPCIRGHRIWVSLILDFLATGMSIEKLLIEYPPLELEDILACIAYGAEM